MSRLPIRLRLTAIFVLAIAVVFALIGAFVFFRTKQAIDDSISQTLHARQGAIRAYARARNQPQIPPGERLAQLVTPAGRLVAAEPPGRDPLLSPAQVRSASTGLHLFELHERERYLAGPVTIGGRRFVVVAGASLAQHERALEGLLGALFIGGPLALLLAGGVSYLVAGTALGSVEAMRRRAATISTADPDAQLPVPEVEDELRRLSVTLNAMLRRIASSAEHERRFIANASHELRTPLSALQAELELADRPRTTEPGLRAAIKNSRQDVERLVALTQSLLELAAAEQRDAATVAELDVDGLLQELAAQARHTDATAGRDVVVQPSGLRVEGDEIALRRALTNLFDNALLHGSGTVTAGAERREPGDQVELWVESAAVLDPSMADDRAFERFARGADAVNRPGAGLGLSLVREIARQHGGDVRLDAADGRVRAVLRLPVATGSPPALRRADQI